MRSMVLIAAMSSCAAIGSGPQGMHRHPSMLRSSPAKPANAVDLANARHFSKPVPVSTLTTASSARGLAFLNWLPALPLSAAIWIQGAEHNRQGAEFNRQASVFNRIASHFTYGVLVLAAVQILGPSICCVAGEVCKVASKIFCNRRRNLKPPVCYC